MFGRSQSELSGLNVNTASANTLTGQSSLPPPSGGKTTGSLFGSSNTSQGASTPQPGQTSSIFGSTSQATQTSNVFGSISQPTQTSSLFGNTSQPAQTGSLFGNTSNTSQPVQTNGLVSNASQPQQTGGLFGSSHNQLGNNQQPQQTSSLFGGAQTNQGTGGGLFGSQQNQQTTGGLFGSKNVQHSQPQPSSLFGTLGHNQTQNQQTSSGVFGGTNNQNKTSALFGDLQNPPQNQHSTTQLPPAPKLFSSQIGHYTQQQQMVPGVRVSVNELRPTTRFNDLHEDLQKAIEFVDNFILQQIDLQGQCAVYTDHIDQMCQQMPPDVDYCTKTLNTMQQALENDAESIAFARGLVKSDAADAKLSFKAIQNLRMPQPSHQSGLWNASAVSQSLGPFFPEDDVDDGATRNIVDFFSKQADDMSKILHTYNRNITEVETYLKGVESNTMQQMEQITSSRGRDGVQRNAGDQVRELAHVLREFGHAIENVAANVSSTRDIVQEVTS